VNVNPKARQVYTESAVLTATPEQLVLMLYDGAIRFLNQAASAYESGDRALARVKIYRGSAILNELNLSLDLAQGEVAARLRSLYLFMKRELANAQVGQDAGRIRGIVTLLSELRDAWRQAMSEGIRVPA
jgi:flagellar protein FliS